MNGEIQIIELCRACKCSEHEIREMLKSVGASVVVGRSQPFETVSRSSVVDLMVKKLNNRQDKNDCSDAFGLAELLARRPL